MTYTPTKEELIELGFLVVENHSLSGTIMTAKYEGNKNTADAFLIYVSSDGSMSIGNRNRLYIQSLDDLKTLIRILTPQ